VLRFPLSKGLLILVLSFVSACASGTATGKVVDEKTQQPLAGVKVSLFKYNGPYDWIRVAYTDQQGQFYFERLPRAQYALIYQTEGYLPMSGMAECDKGLIQRHCHAGSMGLSAHGSKQREPNTLPGIPSLDALRADLEQQLKEQGVAVPPPEMPLSAFLDYARQHLATAASGSE